jgi:hypothetical protein
LSPRQGSVSLADLNHPSPVTLSHVKRKEPRPSFQKEKPAWLFYARCPSIAATGPRAAFIAKKPGKRGYFGINSSHNPHTASANSYKNNSI